MYLKFSVGDTKEVEFHKYNTGILKEGEYDGKPTTQFMYGVRVNGEEVTWYATVNANQILQDNNLKVGDTIVMTRAAEKQYVYMRNGQVLMKTGATPQPTQAPQSNSTLEKDISMLKTQMATVYGKLGMPMFSTEEIKGPLQAGDEDYIDASQIPF